MRVEWPPPTVLMPCSNESQVYGDWRRGLFDGARSPLNQRLLHTLQDQVSPRASPQASEACGQVSPLQCKRTRHAEERRTVEEAEERRAVVEAEELRTLQGQLTMPYASSTDPMPPQPSFSPIEKDASRPTDDEPPSNRWSPRQHPRQGHRPTYQP